MRTCRAPHGLLDRSVRSPEHTTPPGGEKAGRLIQRASCGFLETPRSRPQSPNADAARSGVMPGRVLITTPLGPARVLGEIALLGLGRWPFRVRKYG